jgi:alpha-mannosidase
VTGKQAGTAGLVGCTLLNDSKYGHSLENSTLRLTLIRSSYEPDPLPEIGEHTIRMSIVPHGKVLPESTLIQLGAGFNHPLQVIGTDIHKGSLPAQSPAIIESDSANIVVSSVKKAENDDAFIMHLYETAGKATTAKISIDARLLGQVKDAVEVDFIERPVEKTTAKATKDGLTVKIPAHGIACVKISMTK